MAPHIPALITLALLYLVVLGVGLWAARPRASGDRLEELMLAGRGMPLLVGLVTMTATWVGGGYINGTAEQAYRYGALWGAQAGIGYALALIVGGLAFAPIMRRRGFATLIDPFEVRFGRWTALVMMVPAVLAEVFWSGAILVALGTTFATVLGLDLTTAIVTSASIAVAYTLVGGLRSVAYTDVVQLVLIVVGLGLAVPYVVSAAGGLGAIELTPELPGSAREATEYGDWLLVFVLGGIPWNVYFQRVLAARTPRAAAITSVGAGVLCAALAVPPLLLGLAARVYVWPSPDGIDLVAVLTENPTMVLPYLLRYAVPGWVSVIGLGAIAAAVMSSVDSSILSGASLIAWNGYRRLIHPRASIAVMTRLVRALILTLGALSTWLALQVSSVAALWYLCGDLVYCMLFPQLTLALFDPRANRPGALAGFAVSLILRAGAGEATLGLPAFLPYPAWESGFPYRTIAMVAGLLTSIVVSRATARWNPPHPLTPEAR